mgnify:CR=1 FL=1
MIAPRLESYECAGLFSCCIRYECAFILCKGWYAEHMHMVFVHYLMHMHIAFVSYLMHMHIAFVSYLMHMQRDTDGVPFVIFGLVICIEAYFLLKWSIGRLPEPARMIWYSMSALAVSEIVISPIRCARDGVPLTLRTETAITIRCPLHSM